MFMHRRWIASFVLLATGILAFPSIAQDETSNASPTISAEAPIEINGLDTLFTQTFDALISRADAGDPAAALAVAKAMFASDNIDQQRLGVDYLLAAYDGGATEASPLLADLYQSGGYGLLPDVEKAKSIYEKAIEGGSLDAKLALGRLLINTDFTPEGRDHGLLLVQEAFEAGSISAANFLGGLHRDGRAVSMDTRKALEYFGFGLISGNATSILSVGDILRGGALLLSPNPDLALELFERAASTGQISASHRIADMYLRGEAVAQDIEFGISLLSSLASAGDTNALISLGDLYSRGEIVPTDLDQAARYYQQAAETNATGLLRLANLYISAQGSTPADARRAIEYYNSAAELGSTSALRSLAELYLEGRVVAPNPQRAFDLLNEATAFGDGNAAARLAVLHANNEPYPADYDEVRRYLALSLAMGNTNAIIDTATAIAEGPLVRSYRDEAYALLRNAVDSGLPGAASRLARLQLDGLFPAQGLEGVITMVNTAARRGDRAAARFLIGLYRDGYGLLMRPNLALAEEYLEEVSPLLGPEGTIIERIILEAARGQSLEIFQKILGYYEQLSPTTAVSFLNQLRQINDRAYVFVVQSKLTEVDLFSGAPHGTMDAVTIRSFNAACVAANARNECLPGPMTGSTARVIANFIWGPRPLSE